MKTHLLIILLMISTITFAQKIKKQTIKINTPSKAHYVKIDDSKKFHTQTKNENSNRWWVNKKMKQAEISDLTIKRRRVIVAKSNKQSSPNKN